MLYVVFFHLLDIIKIISITITNRNNTPKIDGITFSTLLNFLYNFGSFPFPNFSHSYSYKFRGCFPTSVSAISLAYSSNDQIEEFTVDFSIQYWESFSGEAVAGGKVTS